MSSINGFNRYNRSGRSRVKRERTILITSSALVLAALTMTGVYMSRNDKENVDDGYTVDLAALEESTDSKLDEIAVNKTESSTKINLEDDLDYMPEDTTDIAAQEAGSSLVEIGEETEKVEPEVSLIEEAADATAARVENAAVQLQFSSELERPVEGETLIPYSMDSSVYFATLDQYKYNPAMIIQAPVGEPVLACAKGKVADIYSTSELGQVVVLELGDGYKAIYGQLTDIKVTVDQYVNAGDTIAAVASPTKYYSTEGSNLYFRLDSEDTPVNPEDFF
jgi:murein DD-endopeptidase MepM/ murein hydrolase activator NlpD